LISSPLLPSADWHDAPCAIAAHQPWWAIAISASELTIAIALKSLSAVLLVGKAGRLPTNTLWLEHRNHFKKIYWQRGT
jgi:hypothetical protein